MSEEHAGEIALALQLDEDCERRRRAREPVVVFREGRTDWLARGFHRYRAHEIAGIARINAHVFPGTVRDAILSAVSDNITHGLKRTNEDKARAINTMLDDPEWSQWENRRIADHCGVDEGTIRNYRKRRQDGSQKGAEVPQSTEIDEVYNPDTTGWDSDLVAKLDAMPAKDRKDLVRLMVHEAQEEEDERQERAANPRSWKETERYHVVLLRKNHAGRPEAMKLDRKLDEYLGLIEKGGE